MLNSFLYSEAQLLVLAALSRLTEIVYGSTVESQLCQFCSLNCSVLHTGTVACSVGSLHRCDASVLSAHLLISCKAVAPPTSTTAACYLHGVARGNLLCLFAARPAAAAAAVRAAVLNS
jgi:hypothetical protein